MSDRPTPETKWYVTEYPEECSFAITDGNEILVTIIGGNTIGDQCDLASRITKLPDLERERDELQDALEHAQMTIGSIVSPSDKATLELIKVTKERDEAREENKKFREALEWIAKRYDDSKPMHAVAMDAYEMSCTAKASLRKEGAK